MRKGLAVLLFASVAVTVFFSPGSLQQGPRSAEPQSDVSSAADAEKLVPSTSLGICKVEEDPLCSKCRPGAICPGKELLETIEDFFGSERSPDALNECNASSPGAPRVWGVPPNVARRMHFLLAIIPDPTHTHLSLFFDRQIEAIQQAAQEAGYNFARANLPWSANERPQLSDLRTRLLQNEYARNREKLPGLLIFRRTAPKDLCAAMEPLFVFVVGETPTGGVNKAQFGIALRAIKDIRDADGASPKPLYVMGPTFAGSLYSLRFLLWQMPRDSFPFTVVHSGTVSSSKTIDWFNTFKDGVGREFRFRTFQESDCYAMAQLTAFLNEQVGPGNVAVLSEDESAYGEELCTYVSSDVMRVTFPRDISALRSAYERDIRNEEASRSAARLPARSTLRSNLEDNGNDDDSVPPFSRLQTPLSEEALLMGIVSNLQKHHTHFIVIRATNPLDALFLARYLRNSYPEGRIITIGADLRFQREIEEPKLHGILALTPYPLLPGSEDHIAVPSGLTQALHSHRVFPSSHSVGTYNAMLSLLGCDPSAPADGESASQSPPAAQQAAQATHTPCEKLPVARYSGYGWPLLARSALLPGDASDGNGSNALVAPLWLSALGNGGYWPVAILQPGDKHCPPDTPASQETTASKEPASLLKCLDARPDWNGGQKVEKSGKVEAREPEENKLHSPFPWKTLCWLGIVTAVVFLFLMWKGSLISTSDISANFAPLKIHGAARNLVFFVIDLLLLLMLLALSWPWMFWGRNFGPNGWGLLIIGIIILVIFVGFKDLQRRGSPVYAWSFLIISLVAVARSCLLAWGKSTTTQPFVLAMADIIFSLIFVGFIKLQERETEKVRKPQMDAKGFLAVSLLAIVLSYLLASADSTMTQPFMMYRLIHITSGLSPLVPLLLLLSAGLWWAWYTLGALVVLDERRPRLPRCKDLQLGHDAKQDRSRIQLALNQISQDENLDITRLMRPNSFNVWLYIPPILFLIIAGTTIEFLHPVKSLEARYFDWMYGALLGFMSAVVILGLSRLALIWLELRKLLTQLDELPLRRSFERLEGFTWKPMWRLGSGALQDSSRLISRQFDSLDHFWNHGTGNRDLTEAIIEARRQRDKTAETRQLVSSSKPEEDPKKPVVNFFKGLRRALFEPQSVLIQKYADDLEQLQKKLALTCASALKYLAPIWETEHGVDMFEVSPTGNHEQRTKEPQEKPATQLAEQFVCLSYLNFILSVIFRMRTLLMSAAGIFVFVLFSFSSYPFEPRSSFHVIMIILFFLVVGTVGVVLAQMHRNGTLSRITNTVPGELGMDFWLRLSAFIVVPLFSLLAAQFPAVGGTLFSWLDSLQSFK